uniref:Fibrillin 1 n=1 Tax=Sarcophilus harrisii TaxID=9305 RepID=A0A7N4PQV3_SARHA
GLHSPRAGGSCLRRERGGAWRGDGRRSGPGERAVRSEEPQQSCALRGAAAAAAPAPARHSRRRRRRQKRKRRRRRRREGGSPRLIGTMRRGGLLELALGFTVLLSSYTSHGAEGNSETGNVKETRASRAKRRGGGGHDALKGSHLPVSAGGLTQTCRMDLFM